MNPTVSEITNAMNRFYKGQITDILFFAGFLIIGCVIIFFGIRLQKGIKHKYKVLGYTLIPVFAVVGIVLCVIKFIPVYQDYTQQNYIIAEDVDLFIHEQSSNGFFDYHDDIDMITEGREKLPLKLYQRNSLSKKKTYHGTIVYTVNSKSIIWYDVSEE